MALRRVVLLSLLLLTLAGCYRQADEGFQPVTIPTEGAEGQTTPNVVITTMPTETFVPNSALTEESTPIDIATDVIATDTIPTNTDTGSVVGPTNTQPLVITIAPTETQQPEIVEPTELQAETPQFITPDGPDGPVAIETNTPNPNQTPLITPTDFFNTDDSGDDNGSAVDGETCEYTVQRGDTLYTIAIDNDITLNELRAANPDVSGDLILAGDVLQIPGCGEGVGEDEPTATATLEETVEGGVVHVVQRGESLYTIAQKYGVTVQEIVDANQLSNPNRIDIGQRLIIPTEDE